jgi:predicted short-subunit dehydrogenase-like oxidoreductase (DUF2520 family)
MTVERIAAKRAVRKGISIIGAGNWGSSLAAGVVEAGIPLLEVVVREKRGRSKSFGGARVVTTENAVYDAEVLWICVPDGEIANASAQIVARRLDLRGQTVVHSSGALTIAALEAVKRAGGRMGGIAPVFSFPTRKPVRLNGVMFAVEADPDGGPGLWRKLSMLVQRLGGKPVRISSDNKVLYHAAATMASPLLVSALQAAVATAELSGLARREAEAVVRVLATATLRNYFERGSERSFSGAFARGDTGTVELHLQALLKHPTLDGVYRALAKNAVDSLQVRNRGEFERILRVVTGGSSRSKTRVRN